VAEPSKYGPTRGELLFRIGISIFGLGFMALAIWLRGIPKGPGLIEVVGLATIFFGGTLLLSVRRLVQLGRMDRP
jgi:hypothetical protein